MDSVIKFWFEELEPRQHWVKDAAMDQLISQRFSTLHEAATKGELWSWRNTPEGRLAEILILDQFSRNMYRDQVKSFAYDQIALVLAQEAIAQKSDEALPIEKRCFLYLPYMHSESLLIHEQAVALFNQPGMESNYRFELKHKEIIERFGRYPHRNSILNRQSTSEELEFLQEPGSSF
ncbi:MAG: hypothetical protein ACJAWS_003292 [Oleiphilaceae bacterium]|jgi:uncharacterized protein (DUF924 family)